MFLCFFILPFIDLLENQYFPAIMKWLEYVGFTITTDYAQEVIYMKTDRILEIIIYLINHNNVYLTNLQNEK